MKYILTLVLLFVLRVHTFSQVDLSTGKAEFSTPLFSYNDPNRLNYGLVLNYTGGGGVKVDEIASEVGLGWNLNSGGVISRQQNGEPDDQHRSGVTYLLSGYLYSQYAPGSACSKRLGWVPISQFYDQVNFLDSDAADKEQDIFHFNFNGKSGSFVIGKNNECVSLTNSRLKITKVDEDMSANNIVTRITKFIITDDDGIQYIFNEKQLSRLYKYGDTHTSIGVTPEFSTPGFCSLSQEGYLLTDYSIVTDWYLSEIKNPLTNKSIVINYEGYDLSYLGARRPFFTRSYMNGEYRTNIVDVRQRFIGVLKRVSSVLFPNDRKIEFEYNSYDRVDLPGSRSLNKVLVKQGATLLFGYQFGYKYFSKGDLRDVTYTFPSAEAPNARMCLTSFRKFGPNDFFDQPYEFTYYQGPSSTDKENWVPPRNSIMQDYFGYYNNIPEGAYEGTNQYQTADFTFHNLHRKFHTPRNNLPYNDPGRLPGGATHIYVAAKNGALKKIKLPNGGFMEFEYEPNTAQSSSGQKVMGGVRVKKVILNDGLSGTNDMTTEYKYVREDGTTSGWGYEEPVLTGTRRAISKQPAGGNYYVSTVVYALARAPIGGKFIYFNNGASMVHQDKSYSDQSNSAIISIVKTFFIYVALQIFNGGGATITIDSDIAVTVPFTAHNPLPFSYSRVEVYKGSSTDYIGKTVYEYTSPEDYPLLVPVLEKPYSGRPRFMPWAYGLLKRMTVYTKNNRIVKDIFHKYAIYSSNMNSDFANSKCQPLQTYMSTLADAEAGQHYITFNSDFYFQISGRSELVSTVDRTYDLTGHYKESVLDYSYDPDSYLIKKISTSNDRGELVEKRVYYPQDYTVAGVLQQMKAANIVGEPVSTETWLFKTPSDPRLMELNVKDFQGISNGDFMPVRKYELQTAAPIPESVIQSFNPSQLIRNTTYIKEDSYATFNSNGSPSQIIQKNHLGSIIYDAAGMTGIATVENASISNIAFTSFEAGEPGNWTIVGLPQYVSDTTVPTGIRCLSIQSVTRLEKSGLEANRKYRVTYWSKNASISVTGGTLLENKTGNTINGWTFCQLLFSGAQAISISGSGLIDEVRLFPLGARMNTITHDEGGNVTSECATDNTVLKYEFDELGRIKYTKDQYGNILRYMEYHNRQL
ncbi:hypothetical protein [Chitinophaga sp. XS-30]|uniref:hypothetical protein n=1 Tax=Chitinophaga sp. XS-30 TaxID=2604421 RepID=UPI0011DE40FD|nr:hypothetical protein [Chitinophaga sp. XS-30]QEH40228.1 hypothetical protein FW415_04820 [Chitinophaga sp. XS-30]